MMYTSARAACSGSSDAFGFAIIRERDWDLCDRKRTFLKSNDVIGSNNRDREPKWRS